MTRQHTVRPQTRDKPTTDTAVWGDSGAGSRPAGWTTQYTRPRQRWLRTSAAGVRYRRSLAARPAVGERRLPTHCCRLPTGYGWTAVDPLRTLAHDTAHDSPCRVARRNLTSGRSQIRT